MRRTARALVLVTRLLLVFLVQGTLHGYDKTKDVMPEVADAARKFSIFAGPVAWESAAEVEAADLIEFVGPDRILVGTVSVTSRGGVPEHGPICLLDAQSGRKLWSAPRPAMPTGSYSLLATQPCLVIVGRDDRSIEAFALDPATGAKRWSTRVTIPAEVQLVGDSLLLLSQSERTLRRIDLASGAITWKQALPSEVLAPDRPASLALAGDAVLIIGPRVLALEFASGRTRWQLDRADRSPDETPIVMPSGLVLWSARSVALVDVAKGIVLWERHEELRTIEMVHASAGSLYLVADGPAAADDVLEILEEASGRARWSTPLIDEAAGPPLQQGDLVILSGESSITAVRKTNGTKVFRTSYSPAFRTARPSAATLLGTPDQLVLRGSKLVVWRERAGLQAFALPGGAALWTQGPYSDAPEFTADGAALLLRTARDTLGQQKASHDKRMGSLRTEQQGLQQQIRDAKTQQGSYVATAFSMVSVSRAWREARRQASLQGLAQRFVLGADAVLRRQARAVQGRYFLDPFIAKSVGRGITVVDLETGLRSDFLYSPLVAPLLDYSVDLLTFTFDPAQSRLLAVGVGFVPGRHQPLEKWGHRLPHPSLFAFEIGKLRFEAGNTLREKAKSEYDTSVVRALGEGPGALAIAAGGGLTDPVRIMLDSGADPNSLYSSGGMTALHLAAFNGHLPVVELLVKRGADVNRTNAQGKTPLDLVLMPVAGQGDLRERRQAIAAVLRTAGARPSVLATAAASPAADLHSAILANDAAAFQAALGRGVAVDSIHEGETPLTRALRERRLAMAAELRRRGCSLTLPGAYGLTPLHYASMHLDLELMQACLAAKANVNAASALGETPLMTIIKPYAPFRGDAMLQAVELLLTNGADPHQKEVLTGKQTLLQVAKAIDPKLAKLLAKHGAK